MRHLSYLGLLAGCLLGTAPLELLLRTRVYVRWRRLLVALLPGLVLGIAWDLYAISRHQWSFDRRYLVGLSIAGLPVEEALFFVVIPVCAVLTLEAVRRCRPGWPIDTGSRPIDTGSWPIDTGSRPIDTGSRPVGDELSDQA